MKQGLITFLIMLICAPILQVSAETNSTRYQIEMIIFKRLRADLYRPDMWLPVTDQAPITNAVELTALNQDQPTIDLNNQDSTSTQPNDFKLLDTKNFTLTRQDKILRKANNYQVLLHLVWQQPINNQSTNIAIHGGKKFEIDNTQFEELRGRIQINKQRFFNINADLNLTLLMGELPFAPPVNIDYEANAIPKVLRYHLTQSRRTKTEELNYLDSPVLGVLMKITPISVETS